MNKQHLSTITELQGYIFIAYLKDNGIDVSYMTEKGLKEYEKHRDKKLKEFYEALRFYYE